MKKKIAVIFIAAICAFACAFVFTGCADSIQKNCDHSWVLQKNDPALRESTCSQKGISAVYKCWKCQKYDFKYSPLKPHTFDETKNSIDYCRETDTYLSQTCSVCDSKVLVQVPCAVHKLTLSTHYAAEDGEKHVCAHTDYRCALCRKIVFSEYEHRINEESLNLVDEYKEAGDCGVTYYVKCIDCDDEVKFCFHDYTSSDEEIIFIDSTCKIVKKVCTFCNCQEKYEISFFIDGNWVKNPDC